MCLQQTGVSPRQMSVPIRERNSLQYSNITVRSLLKLSVFLHLFIFLQQFQLLLRPIKIFMHNTYYDQLPRSGSGPLYLEQAAHEK